MVFVLVGLGAGLALRGGVRRPAGAVAVMAIAALTAWNVGHLPPAVHPDGGFPPARLPAIERTRR